VTDARNVWLPDGRYGRVAWDEWANEWHRIHGSYPPYEAYDQFINGNLDLHRSKVITVNPFKPEEEKKAEVAIPGGINILPVQRVGDSHRNAYADHLANMWAAGLLNQEEYEARRDFAMSAETREQLEIVTRDLPSLPRTPRVKIPAKKKSPFVEVAGHPVVVGAALGAGVSIMEIGISHLTFIVALCVTIFFVGLGVRWFSQGR
jgi:hypothetical protein